MSAATDRVRRPTCHRYLVSVVCVALAGVVAACSSGGTAPTAESSSPTTTRNPNVYLQQRTDGVQRLLDDLSRALRAGDTTALDDLIDPSADAAFRDRLRTAAETLAGRRPPSAANTTRPAPNRPARTVPPAAPPASGGSATGAPEPGSSRPSAARPPSEADRGKPLRFAEFRYQVTPTEEPDSPVPPELQAPLDAAGSSDSWIAPVELRYALGGASVPGVDEPEIVVNSQLLVARYDSAWKVVGYPPAPDAAPPAQLWDFPGVAARDVATAGGTSAIISYPGTAGTVVALRAQLPGAVDATSRFWGDDWARRAVLVATDDQTGFDALARSGGTTADAAAASVYATLDVPAGTVTGQRIVFAPSVAALPEPTLAVVLRHELTHIAARTQTAPSAPVWVTEGVAEYVGRKGTYVRLADAAPDLAAAVRAGRVPAGLPADGDFAVDAASSAVAYQSAWSLAAFVADRFGEQRLKKLYVQAAAGDAAKTDTVVRAALGIDRERLLADWRRWLAEQVR